MAKNIKFLNWLILTPLMGLSALHIIVILDQVLLRVEQVGVQRFS